MANLMNKFGISSDLSSLKSASAQEAHEKGNVDAISSVWDMTPYLESIKKVASPALAQVLQMQISVLSIVESPSLVGMILDNMTDALKEALQKCEESQRSEIQRSFARMVQSIIFVSEAKLKYASDKNKKAAAELLVEAGTIMSQTISATLRMAVPGAEVPDAVANVIASRVSQSNFFGKIGAVLVNKKFVEAKQEEFYETLEQIFVILDKYPLYYGKSVIVNGLVAKYKDSLVDVFAKRKLKPILDNMSAVQMQAISEAVEGLTSDLAKASYFDVVTGLLKAGGRILGNLAGNKSAKSSLKSFCRNYDSYETRIGELQRNVSEAESRLAELKQQRRDVGLFSFGAKKESNLKIEEQEVALKQCKTDLSSAVNRFNSLKNMCPQAGDVYKEIYDYESFLDSLESKYAVD